MPDEATPQDIESIYQDCKQCIATQMKAVLSCDDPCFTLLNHSLTASTDLPWTYFYRAFEPWVVQRVRGYCFRYQLSDTLVDHFVNITFFRYWKSLQGKPEKLKNFKHALNYLRVCARSTVLDSTKNRIATHEQELDPERLVAPPAEPDEFEQLWSLICQVIPNERDQQLIYCYIVLDLKPREIMREFPGLWPDVNQIKVDWQRVRRQLRRNSEINGWFNVD